MNWLENDMNSDKALHAMRFVVNPAWDRARWSATTFRWHPRSEFPPVMGLVFEDAMAGQQLFCDWSAEHGNVDPLEELRVAIIEGDIEGLRRGYTVHLSGDVEGILARATIEGIAVPNKCVPWISRVNRMHPEPGSTLLLPRFKEEFARHQEYLVAPVTRRGDGQLWFDIELGIVKHKIHFRQANEIADNDIDAVVKQTNLVRTAQQG